MRNIKTFKLFESKSIDLIDVNYINDILIDIKDANFDVNVLKYNSSIVIYICKYDQIDEHSEYEFVPNEEFIQQIHMLSSYVKDYEMHINVSYNTKDSPGQLAKSLLHSINELGHYYLELVKITII